jgi:hypothetical protein
MGVLQHLKRAEETIIAIGIGIGKIPTCVAIEDIGMIEEELQMREALARALGEIHAARRAYNEAEDEEAAAWASLYRDVAFEDIPAITRIHH